MSTPLTAGERPLAEVLEELRRLTEPYSFIQIDADTTATLVSGVIRLLAELDAFRERKAALAARVGELERQNEALQRGWRSDIGLAPKDAQILVATSGDEAIAWLYDVAEWDAYRTRWVTVANAPIQPAFWRPIYAPALSPQPQQKEGG